MNRSNTPQKRFVKLPAYEDKLTSELSADYILPDTYPDVKKILRVSARPVLIGRYISGKRLELSGGVDYIVIFSADTENGESVHCVHFAGEWNAAAGDIENLDAADISIVPRVTACAARLSNPRKLSIRSTVASSVDVCAPKRISPKCEGAKSPNEELRLESLTKTIYVSRRRTFVCDPLRLSEDLETDASSPAIDEIISCTADIRFHEARPMEEADDFTVTLKGTAFVDIIYKAQGETGVYRSFSRKLPISYIAGADECRGYFDGCRPDTLCAYAMGTPIEINVAVGEDNYGERRIAELDMTADITVTVMGGEDSAVTLDMYSTERDCECVMTDIECSAPARIIPFGFSVGESLSRSELAVPENAQLINGAADVTMTAITVERGRPTLTGNASVSCIFLCEDGSFASAEATLPVKCELPSSDIHEPVSFTCDACASDMRVRLDGERVCFDFEVSFVASICERSRYRAVDVIRLMGDTKEKSSDASMLLCYPSADDTLWQVAKRYNTTVAAIEAANAPDARVIMIPRTSAREFTV